MTINPFHPYTLEVLPSVRKPGTFDWTIRRSGKLVQRSDRILRTEEEAMASGAKEIERQIGASRKER
ncbi:hypothetical protein [Enterovirga sp.]|jgi:hypothetical protein|uniref:hypothetical protein n=1 Tax=Enterovirga sp. TaxID=2026350 RepID=UPI002621272A|nr:hypothetical protein [Enterovirga sp.]MDB5590825.1 hypothetical protein [Enterovirga sp.]